MDTPSANNEHNVCFLCHVSDISYCELKSSKLVYSWSQVRCCCSTSSFNTSGRCLFGKVVKVIRSHLMWKLEACLPYMSLQVNCQCEKETPWEVLFLQHSFAWHYGSSELHMQENREKAEHLGRVWKNVEDPGWKWLLCYDSTQSFG